MQGPQSESERPCWRSERLWVWPRSTAHVGDSSPLQAEQGAKRRVQGRKARAGTETYLVSVPHLPECLEAHRTFVRLELLVYVALVHPECPALRKCYRAHERMHGREEEKTRSPPMPTCESSVPKRPFSLATPSEYARGRPHAHP